MDIIIPNLGESVVQARVMKWLKKEGDIVKTDEVLVELETDKITVEVPSPASGTLIKIIAEEGSTQNIGAILGQISEVVDKKSFEEKEEKNNSKKEEKILKEENQTPKDSAIGSSQKPLSFSLREHAQEKIKQEESADNLKEERVPLSPLRKRIAERMMIAQNTAAQLTTFNEIDMTRAQQIREHYGEDFIKKHGVKLGWMSFFVRGVIKALQEIPILNAEMGNDEIIYKHFYNIGIAVGTDKGLIVPVLKNADLLSFAKIEKQISEYAQRARDMTLNVDDLRDGTFTITNGGVYGSLMSTPFLNPPQSGILGLHKIQKRAVVINDKIEIRPMMYVALTYDHRLVDGKEAVTFLVRVKEAIEDPDHLLLDL